MGGLMPEKYNVVLGATLKEAQEWLFDNVEEGAECPCCVQLARLYKRSLNSPMARLLIWLVRQHHSDARWYTIHEFPLIQGRRGGGDFAKLTYWGLIEEQPKDPEDTEKRTSGIWRPTAKGVDFAHARIRVPKRVHLYNNTQVGWDEEQVSIRQALGKKFDYHELTGW
jgi:hypothetical protein